MLCAWHTTKHSSSTNYLIATWLCWLLGNNEKFQLHRKTGVSLFCTSRPEYGRRKWRRRWRWRSITQALWRHAPAWPGVFYPFTDVTRLHSERSSVAISSRAYWYSYVWYLTYYQLTVKTFYTVCPMSYQHCIMLLSMTTCGSQSVKNTRTPRQSKLPSDLNVEWKH